MKRLTTKFFLMIITVQLFQISAMDRSLVLSNSASELKWTKQITLEVSTKHMTSNPKISALVGGLVGGCVIGACIERFGNNWSPVKKYGLIFGGAVISGAISFLTHYDRIERDLKEDQREIDNIRWQNNSAVRACEEAQKCRSVVKGYLQNTSESNRRNLYVVVYNHLKKNDHPVKDAIYFLKEDLARAIKYEAEGLADLKRNMVNSLQFKCTFSQATMDRIDEMFEQMKHNARIIERLNNILSYDQIERWINAVILLPEYTADFDISGISDLVNYATACKRDLRKAFLTFVQQRRECKVFINRTIAAIRATMKDYENTTKKLNARIDTYNAEISQVPQEIKKLLEDCGYKFYELNVYPMNPSLFQYEKFLADDFDNEDQELEKWIELCFSDLSTIKK